MEHFIKGVVVDFTKPKILVSKRVYERLQELAKEENLEFEESLFQVYEDEQKTRGSLWNGKRWT